MSYDELKQKVRSYRQQNGEQPQSGERRKTYDELKEEVRQKRFQEDVSKVDQDYLNLFVDTANDFFSSAQSDIGWDNAVSVYQKSQSTLKDLDYRRSVISSWLASNKDSLEPDAYKSLSDSMSLFSSDSSKVMSYLSEAKDYYDKDKNLDAYLAYVDHQNKMGYDLDAGQKKIDDLNRAISLRKDIQAIDHDVPTDITSEYEALLKTYGWSEGDDLKELLSAETVMFNQSKWTQKEAELASAVDSPDFAKYSKMGAEIQNPSYKDANGWLYLAGWRPGADDVKNKVTFARDNADALVGERENRDGNSGIPSVVDPIYRHMTEDEVAIYNYYLAKEGEEKADEYLDSILDTLNRREAGEEFAHYQGRTGLEILYGATAGADQFRSGMASLWDSMFGDSEYIPPSSIQYAGQAMRQDLEDNGPTVFGSSLGQIGYDALSTTTNMAPSILASIAVGSVSKTAGAAVGNALLGASAAGNAYQQKLNEGYSKEQARTYGLMVGASEIAMEKLLGGISAFGGGMISETVLKNFAKLDNVLGKVAKSVGGKIFMNATSEAIEEGLQSILEPYLWQIVSGEDASVELQEALYSSLLGFVTGGVFEGANASFETVARNNATKQKYGAMQGDIVTEALEIDSDSKFAQKMQNKLDNGKDLSGAQINKLIKNNESSLVKNDIASIQKAAEATLVKYGETGDVKVISEALAKQAAGKSLTRAEKTAIADSKYGQRVANELNPENIQRGDFNTAWAESIDTNRINVEEYSRLVQDAELDVADTAPESTVQSGTSAVNPLRTGETNGTDSTISEGVQESSPVADTSASLEEASRKYGAQAKAMVATYNQGPDVAMFDSAYSVAYEMGKSGVGVEYAVNSEATRYLTQAQRELAYRQGTFAGKSGTKSLDAKYKGKGAGNSGRKRGAVKLEGIKASEFKKMLKDSKDPRGKAAKALMTIAEVTGIDIVLFKSELDASGRYVGEQGKFVWKDDTIYIDLNAGLSYGSDAGELTKYAMLRTFGHEFTHFMEKNAANQYTEFRKLVFAEMTKKGENVDYLIQRKQIQYKDEKLSYEAASREVVADAMGDILRDSNFVENLAQKHNGLFKTLLDQFKRFIRNIRSYFNSLADNPSPEAKALKEELNGTMKYLDSIVEMFDKVAMEAVENYQQRIVGDDVVSELTPGEEGVVVAEDGEPVAYSTEDGTVMLSIRTYEEEGRSAFRTYLEKCVKNKSLTETEMTEMLDGIEEVYNICKKFKDQYAPFSAWSDAEVIRDTHGKPVFSVVTPNGEYKMNLDFSLVCKKRRALDAVLNEMCKRGIIDNFELGPKTIVKINELIRKNKLETACSLCFVDAKRFRQADVADSVVRLYNELVQSLVPEEHSRSIDHFNFAGYGTITPTENGIHTWPNSKLDFSHINEVLKQYGKNTVEAKAARYIKNNAEARRLLLRGDFMSSSGFDAVKTRNPNIMKIYNSKKGTGGPKAAFGDVQYMNEIISNNKSWTPEKAYDVGGVRIQSFSDYVPRMVFDYVQMVYDLAAKKLPAHAYTKEALFVMQFGLTGIKINMSLIPAIVDGGIAPGLDANGEYAWAGESFDFETAKDIQKANGYSENCGTIAVGVSYEHIKKLLEDPDIRMVIPYHKSSLNPIVAHMNRIGEYTDYTKPGKTPDKHGGQRTTDKNGKTVTDEFNFAKILHEVGDPKAVADQYLAWCDKEGYTPKFDEFREHENYYKLLTDFTVYDESGNYVAQREVKAIFPKKGNKFGEMEKLIESGLKEDAIIQSKRDSLIPKIVDEIERTIARTEAEISDDEQVEQADHDVEAELMDENLSAFYDSHVQRSARVYDEDTLEFLNNQKTIKTYKTMQIVDGKLYPPMAARTEGQYEDYSILGEWEQATEHPDLIKNGKYKLDKGKGQGSIEAAYNPYMHSSDLPINDQFSSAYKRDNLVTVECEVPVSEMTSGYHAQYAKDSVGWHSWHTGTVAGAIRKARGIERRVFLSRWIKPVRIVPDSEVAVMYKKLIADADITIPDNVVTPSLLSELKKIGVKTKESGLVQKSIRSYDSVEEMDNDYLSAVDSEDVKTQKEMVAEAAKRAMPDTVVVDTKGDLMLMYHGTANGGAFTVFEGNKLSNESRTSQIGQGFYFTNSKADAEAYTKNVDIYGRVGKGSNPHLHQVYLNITNPFDVRNDTLDLDKVKSVYMDGGYDYFYDNWIPFYLDKKSVNGRAFTKADLKAMSREERVSAFVDYYSKVGSKEVLSNMVRAFGSQNQGALLESMKTRLGYDGIVEEYKPGLFQYVAFSSEQIKSADPVTYDDNGNVIPLSERFNEEKSDIRYSLRTYDDDYAPTFYSQMEKVVSGMKQDKFGASSVVSMLRGRGVKAEEIKWSGIEAWLEGKKSVTKAELQEFIAGSMLQIEEDVLTDKEIPYSKEHQDQIAKYESERDIIAEQLKSEWKRIVGTDIPITYFGPGLESAVVNNLMLANSEKKGNTEIGYQYKAKKAALQRVIEDGDDYFGFDNARQAFREAARNPKAFMKATEMTAFEESVFKDFIKAKEAYAKVEGISIEDQKALKAIAESADRFSNRIVDVKNKHRSEAAKHLIKYRAYTIKGGTNYRELLFLIPDSTYSNGAMHAHWERSGVLAHARIQDINTFLGKMLFIEELQSDWHNEGRKTGYEGVPDAPFRDNYHEFVLKKLIRMAAEQGYDSIGWTPAEIQSERWSDEFAEGYRIEYDQDIPKFLNKYGKKWDTKVGKTVLDSGTEVWSMAITDSMKDSVLYEGQAQYQLRTNTLTDHEILDMASKELDTSKLTEGEKAALDIFRKKVTTLKALKEERQKQGSLYYEAQFGENRDKAKASAARNRMTVLDGKITKASAEVLGIEDKKILKDVLQKSRKVIEQHERKASIERVKAAREEARVKERKIANEKLEALRKKKNEQIKEVRAEERERATERVQNVREGYQSSRLREKIRAFKAKLEKNLLKPTERQYVPAGLTQAMIDVVNLIDIDTDLINEDGTINKAQERRNETKMKLSDLAAEYERLKASDPVYAGEFDEAVYNYLTELRDNFAGRHLREMTLSELTEMYEILRSIEETLQDARKLIGWGDAETVYEAGDSIIAEQNAITAKRKDGKRTWKQEKRDNTLALTLSPVRYVERMAGYNQDSFLLKMFKAFERGIRKKNMFKMEAYKSFEALTSRQQFEDAVYNPAGKTYTDANGRSFRLSKMQMMQAILSLEREQANNMSHIDGSGFSFADLDMLQKGRLKDAISEEYSHRVPNAVAMVGDFVELLKNDKWAQDYMAAARKFFNETAKDAINETSLALKHRIVAKDKSYIPFEVDKNFIVNEISAANDVQQTINSYGMLKDTKKFASNPLIITGLNNILDRHIEQVGNIYGLAIEVRNFNKVWNVRGLEADSGDPTVKATIQRNWGDKGLKLVEQAVQDIQGPRQNSQSAIYKKIKSGYIGATFLLNLSVVTKQVGSLFSATSMLRWRGPVRQIGNLIYTMTHSKKLSAEVDKYSASAWMRRQGLSDAEVYTLMTEGKRTWMGRLASKAPAAVNPTKWITGMDHAVALSLWKYAKEDTAKRTGLKGEELLIATAEFYDELIENTQSMTDVLHRPEIQKKSDVISEAFGMFKTDLYQMAGQLLVSKERYQANKTKENGNALARTAYAVTMSAVWAQLMTAVFAALRYKVDQYRDDEDKDITVESWMKRQGVALIGDFAGYIFPLIGSDAVGFLENIFNDESDELVDSLGITAINNTYDAIINVFAPLADGELPKTSDLRKLTTNALQMFGVPANNILRTLDAIQLHAKDIANGEFLSFEAGVQRSSANHAHRIMEAVQKGDMDLANALFEEAVEESALKKSEDGSISDQALKDAQSALQTAFGKKYKDGEISAEQAEQILVDLFGKSEDDAYWTIKAWDNGGDSRYSAVFDAALSGTGFNEAVKEMTDHGYEKEDILSKLKTQVKTWYTDEESEVRISKQQATDMLRKYVGMNADDVTSTINQWSCKVVTGIAYEDIKDEFLAGNITASRAIDMRVRYGGKSREDAQKEVESWNFEKKYGFSYSDRKNAYINGEVSASELRNAMITYGGMTAEEADENIRAYDWLKRNPKYDLSVSDVIAYTKPISDIGKSIEQTGIKPDVYMQYKDLRSKCKGVDSNGDGKTDSGSVKTEVLKAIDSLPISSSQKDALYYLNGWAKSKLWEAPWH